MIVSLNEVESIALKAARGAGYSWGMAEEAGQAARWLAERRQPWGAALVALFDDRRGGVCPIALGTRLSDDAEAVIGPQTTVLGTIVEPLLLLPFLQPAARSQGTPLVLSAETFSVRAGDREVALQVRDAQALSGQRACALARATGPTPVTMHPLIPLRGGVALDDRLWHRLQTFAARTYVPDSATSRLKGAGAGLVDTD